MILEMLKDRTKLGLVKRPQYTNDELIEVEKQLTATAARQKLLGLGDSSNAVARAIKSLKDQRAFEAQKPLAIQLKEKMGLKFVEGIPKEFMVFNLGSQTLSASKLPELVSVKLVKDLKAVTVRTGNREYKANIPIIPSTVLEIARRCKNLAPKGKFHILFQPSWEMQPQRDPVLLFEVARRFAVVGAWDKDADVINEFLVSEK